MKNSDATQLPAGAIERERRRGRRSRRRKAATVAERVAAMGHVFMTWKGHTKRKRGKSKRGEGDGEREKAKRKQITKCCDHFYFPSHSLPPLSLSSAHSPSLSLLALGFYGRQRRVPLELRVQRAVPQRGSNGDANKVAATTKIEDDCKERGLKGERAGTGTGTPF